MWINAPHFCAGVVLERGKVTRAAPILHYMVGWSKDRVVSYCRHKKWVWVVY